MAAMDGQRSLEFAQDDSQAGFRLWAFELYNWGTFHDKIWRLPLDGKNGLLTGEIGSGKSTVVDAVTTLLISPNRVAYNKAAGAETRERSLKSYVEGYFKSERDENSMARPVSLRGPGSYSVILGCFYNAGFDQYVTLAQVFWIKEGESQPERFYVVSDRELSIAGQFTHFEGDTNALRKRLKNSSAEVMDSFVKYKAQFSRALGIRNEQALNLFHQTVSMKSVGNLTDFVRNHMLEPFDAGERIDRLIQHFDDLTRAHHSIGRAKRQIELLIPLVADGEQYATLHERIRGFDACVAALDVYFARFLENLLSCTISKLNQEELHLDHQLSSLRAGKEDKARRADELKRAIYDNGGNRIEILDEQLVQKEREQGKRRGVFDRYAALVRSLDLPSADTPEVFVENGRQSSRLQGELEQSLASNQNATVELMAEDRDRRGDRETLQGELRSLRARKSNIGRGHIDIRERLLAALGNIGAEALPFIGELLQVRREDGEWEGAAERILHNFGLSLLVPDEHYRAVSEWVEKNHIAGRIVYYRVRNEGARRPVAPLFPGSLVRKLEIKPDTPFEDWLEGELISRFNYACCDTMDQFRCEQRAVTRSGQIKANEKRHEKDDRHRIDDRSRYILGWDNRSKLLLLEGKERQLQAEIEGVSARLVALRAETRALRTRERTLAELSAYRDFGAIHWQETVLEIEQLKKERNALLETSEKLRELKEQLSAVNADLRLTEDKIEKTYSDLQGRKGARVEAESKLAETRLLLSDDLLRTHSPCFEQIDAFRGSFFGDAELTVPNCHKHERLVRDKLIHKKDADNESAKRLSHKIIGLMSSFCVEFPLETQDFDTTVESISEYARMLERLRTDDLPRFEAKFKELLNENTIREIANFQAQLNNESRDIKERIDKINKSLAQIDYTPGRYIVLEAHRETHPQIRSFQADLKACTEDAISGSQGDTYSEGKFQNVCRIVERFKGRPEFAEADKRWTAFVTDVRNWFSFSAAERWKETNEEYEHYTDSGGKSGGQKEKLAYTILAASLAYQFGLEAHSPRSRTFRFVVIDEAFGRGSDESAQFALELFQTLRLQLLIVTPLQKIHVIEPYVSRVGFVHNIEGKNSCLRNLTIEEYLEEKKSRGHVDDGQINR